MRFFHSGFGRLDVGDPLKEVRSLRQCAIHRRVDVVVDGTRNSQLSQWLDVYGSLWNRSESGSQVPVSNLLGSEHCLQFVFRLAYLDELSGSEACAMLGVSAGIFKARLCRAKRQVFNQADRALVAPIHKKTLSPSEFLKRK